MPTPNEQRSWLVTGASGQLGGHVAAYLCRHRPVDRLVALSGRSRTLVDGAATVRAALTDLSALRQAVLATRPTHIIHLAAMTAVSDAFANPDLAQRTNVDATRALAEAAEEVSAKMVFSSTDMVFDGDHAPYAEAAAPNPLSEYGRSKLAAERALEGRPRVLTVRIPLLFGLPVTPRKTTFYNQMQSLWAGEPLKLFRDEYRTPLWLPDAAACLVALAESDLDGLIHLAGPQRLSRLELLAQCASALGVPNPKLIAISRSDVAAPEPRPEDLSLDDSRLRRLRPDLPRTTVADAMRMESSPTI